METLFDYTEAIYNNLGCEEKCNPTLSDFVKKHTYEELIKDDDKCIELIEIITDEKIGFDIPNKNRASHIVITCLLGIGLGEFFHLNHHMWFPGSTSYLIWMLTATLHDYGYFCKEIETKTELDKFRGEYYLLQDVYSNERLAVVNDMYKKEAYSEFLAYTYEEIENYHKYRINVHLDDYEQSDHGIIGGCKSFERYCNSKWIRTQLDSVAMVQAHKIACITTASHNIYKSNSRKSDVIYKKYGLESLMKDAPIKVTKDKKLLLLLSLVDTIECTKRFSKRKEPKSFLQQNTTIKKVNISTDKNKVIVDYSNLYCHIEKRNNNEEMKASLEKHIRSLAEICNWTDFKSKLIENYSVEITL